MVHRDTVEILASERAAATRILVVDAHPTVRAGWRATVGDDESMVVVGEASDARTAISLTRQLTPDVAIITESLGVASAIGLCRALVDGDRAPGVLLVLHERARWPKAVLAESGATRVASSNQPLEQLRRAIREVAAARDKAKRMLSHTAPTHARSASTPILSEREAAVIRMVAEGQTHKEIASKLQISPRTLQTYRIRAMTKLGLGSRQEMMCYAVARGWLAPPVETNLTRRNLRRT